MLEYVVKALAGQLEHYSRTVGVMFNPSDGTWGVAGTRHRGHTVAGARGKSVAERKADAEERALQRRLPSLPGELEYGMQVLVETMRDEFEADARRAGLAAAEAAAEAAGRVAAVAARVRRIIDGTFSGTARWDKVLNEICDSCEVEAEAEAGRAERDRLWPEALHDVAAGAFGLAELALEDEVCAGYPVYHKPKKGARAGGGCGGGSGREERER